MDTAARREAQGHWAGYDWAWGIDTGKQRPRNEDALELCELGFADGARGLLLAVADGLGGGANGDRASQRAVAEIAALAAAWQSAPAPDWPAAYDALAAAFTRADAAIRDEAGTARVRTGATTLVAALVLGSRVLHLHVGDSRLYVFGPGGAAYRTRDQTMAQVYLDAGRIASEAEATPRQRNTLFSVLGGDRPTVSIEPAWAAAEKADQPALCPLAPGQTLLLCTDGLWGQMPPDTLRDVCADPSRDLPAIRATLFDMVYAAEAPDNIAMILVRARG